MELQRSYDTPILQLDTTLLESSRAAKRRSARQRIKNVRPCVPESTESLVLPYAQH
jgi:hypothetical protein